MTREEDTPFAGWAFAEGGEFSDCPVSKDRDPREEETSRINIDKPNMAPGTLRSNGPLYMSAMRPVQGKGSGTDRKNGAPLGGKRGPEGVGYFAPTTETDEGTREGTPFIRAGFGLPGRSRQGMLPTNQPCIFRMALLWFDFIEVFAGVGMATG